MRQTLSSQQNRFPHAIVWSPIPVITWIIPFIGHMGITDSEGNTYDFAGSYYISLNHLAFGNATRYLVLDPALCRGETWDSAVQMSCEIFKERIHRIFYDNCHSHVAHALEYMIYDGKTHWNMVTLCFWVLVRARYVSIWGFIQQWMPFCILIIVVAAILY